MSTMIELPLEQDTIRPGQWRLAEVQLANWGTFDGAIYRLPIARQGHLITGPSGSGKSSLLDAIAAVLTPDKWLRLNQAAQGAGTKADQRSIPSYLRGAWSRTVDETEDRVVSANLRSRATWSGIILRYENGTDQPISLCRLFFLRAAGTTMADITDLCLIERSDLDLRDLEPHVRSGIEARKIQQAWPDAMVTTNQSHGKFYARLRSLFGIANENALHLLHKTQAAKNLDSLDQLFRDYMLDKPGTFALADNAVTQFGELRDAHDRVVQLREQRDHLRLLKKASDDFAAANTAVAHARELSDSVTTYQKRRALLTARSELEGLEEQLVSLEDSAESAAAAYTSADETLTRADRQALQLGGAEAEHVQATIRAALESRRATTERWESLRRQLATAGIAQAPTTAVEYAELLRAIDQLLRTPGEDGGATYVQHQRHSEAKKVRADLDREIQSIRLSGSTVPELLVRTRELIAESVGIPTSALPFAAELIEVLPEHEAWTGAIERVLRPISLALLVRSEHLRAVRQFVDTRRLPGRLVFEEVTTSVPSPRPARSDRSLVRRVRVSEGPFTDWLNHQLSERFDVACVDHPDDLDDHVRAVTINGQVKTSRTRYEKDDRRRIDDRGLWVLGDRAGKLEALVQQLRRADAELAAAQEILDRAQRESREIAERRGALSAIKEQRWSDVDVDAADQHVADLERQLSDLTRDDNDLAAALQVAKCAREDRAEADRVKGEARAALDAAVALKRELVEDISTIEAAIAAGTVPELADHVTSALEERFRSVRRNITRRLIAEVGQTVTQQLSSERAAAQEAERRASDHVVGLATRFKGQWPAAATDLSAGVEDRLGYVQLLNDIEARGLPEHVANFLRLLRDRSRDMTGGLVSEIQGAIREVEERVRPVNASLRRSKFDHDRYLNLRVKGRRTETVNRFIADLKSISQEAWSDDDVTSAENRFDTLAEIMRKLASSDPADRRWREACLDTRQHVTFLAEEVDERGRAHATYDSGAAMSGGQQQKLVVFCLAAALRYQLADAEDLYPRYGTIVLDEAFDKADTRYTRMALDIFVEFGFQLVLATPQKLLQTIEPYVGAATSIDNPTRKKSEISNVPWHEMRFRTDSAST